MLRASLLPLLLLRCALGSGNSLLGLCPEGVVCLFSIGRRAVRLMSFSGWGLNFRGYCEAPLSYAGLSASVDARTVPCASEARGHEGGSGEASEMTEIQRRVGVQFS
jgi:hypothetical protein